MTNILLTGQVHIGKTTVCQSVVEQAHTRGRSVGGVLTPAVFDSQGQRVGFDIIDLATLERRQLARLDCDLGGPSIGPHYFDSSALQWGHELIVRALAQDFELLVIDEIGRLELEQDAGFRVVSLLATTPLPNCLLVVRTPLVEIFRQRLPQLRHTAFELTMSNRNRAASQVFRLLSLLARHTDLRSTAT